MRVCNRPVAYQNSSGTDPIDNSEDSEDWRDYAAIRPNFVQMIRTDRPTEA